MGGERRSHIFCLFKLVRHLVKLDGFVSCLIISHSFSLRPNLPSFLPLICIILLFRSPHVALRKEARPLSVQNCCLDNTFQNLKAFVFSIKFVEVQKRSEKEEEKEDLALWRRVMR